MVPATRPAARLTRYILDSTLHPNAYYYAVVTTSLTMMTTACAQSSPQPGPFFIIHNPCSTRSAAAQKLKNAFMRDGVCTGSSTSPLTGNQTFTIPVTSWDYKG